MEKKRFRLTVTSYLCVALSLLLVALYFLPLGTYTESAFPEEDAEFYAAMTEHFGLRAVYTGKDFLSPSLFSMTRFISNEKQAFIDYYADSYDPQQALMYARIIVILSVSLGLVWLVTALLAFLRLPWPMLIAEGLGFFAFSSFCGGLSDKLASPDFLLSIWFRAYRPCLIALVILTVLMIGLKHSYRYALKKEQMNAE